MTVWLTAVECVQGCDYHAAHGAGRFVGLAFILLLIAGMSLGPAIVFHLIDRRSQS